MSIKKQFIYQRFGAYFASVCDGVENLLKQELLDLGARKAQTVYRGVNFDADQDALYRINYMSGLATRIYAPLMQFACHSTKYLHRTAVNIPWDDFLSLDKTFAISATVSHSAIKHSKYAALCLKDAVADYFWEKYDKRPNVDTDNPDVWINLHIQENKAHVSIDTSGGSLHRRGYRVMSTEAPMQESVAAAIVRMSGWKGDRPLYDPMCGSGTLLAEAALYYSKTPPAWQRKAFGFIHLPDYKAGVWKNVKQQADKAVRDIPTGLIEGSDRDRNAVQAALKNLEILPSGKRIFVSCTDFQSLKPPKKSVIVCNPPYGIRMGNKDMVPALHQKLGEFLKKCKGSEAFVYFGNPEMIPALGLEPKWQKFLKNGGLKGKLVKYIIPD
ncbi:MAG: class I SAM-dependent RNA methyltransferase [Fibrobacteria bacterium]|nr:class I SAM-dependent RNA methyltransferase [Fibrobacteria bacterium]